MAKEEDREKEDREKEDREKEDPEKEDLEKEDLEKDSFFFITINEEKRRSMQNEMDIYHPDWNGCICYSWNRFLGVSNR